MSRHFNDSGEKNYGPLILQAHISWIQMYRPPKNSRKKLNAKKKMACYPIVENICHH